MFGLEQDMLPVHFGVGSEKEVDIKVRWTDGEVCTFSNLNVEVGHLLQISEVESGCIMSDF